MEKISSDVLTLISEAAVIIKEEKISFANFSAQEILGANCVGKSAKSIFGAQLAECKSPSFIGDVTIRSVPCAARAVRLEDRQIVFISPAKKPDSILNESFLCTMRNSLMSLELSAALLREKCEKLGEADMLQKIAVVNKHYYRMTRLINNASFTISDEAELCCSMSPVNISRLYSEIIDSFDFFTNGIKITASLGQDLILNCDATLIKRLILNLISNCIIHARGCTAVDVSFISSGENLILSVSDNGCGIDPDDLHMVFDRYRYGFSISEMGKGAGLGLSVCRRIARLHGGTLLLESRPGQGTMVKVSIAKKFSPIRTLRSSRNETRSFRDDILLEFSDCLGPEFYTEKFMD